VKSDIIGAIQGRSWCECSSNIYLHILVVDGREDYAVWRPATTSKESPQWTPSIVLMIFPPMPLAMTVLITAPTRMTNARSADAPQALTGRARHPVPAVLRRENPRKMCSRRHNASGAIRGHFVALPDHVRGNTDTQSGMPNPTPTHHNAPDDEPGALWCCLLVLVAPCGNGENQCCREAKRKSPE
jgi:hypothetical protein